MTKNILFNIVLILFALTSCTPSTVNIEEETNASQMVNPNAEITSVPNFNGTLVLTGIFSCQNMHEDIHHRMASYMGSNELRMNMLRHWDIYYEQERDLWNCRHWHSKDSIKTFVQVQTDVLNNIKYSNYLISNEDSINSLQTALQNIQTLNDIRKICKSDIIGTHEVSLFCDTLAYDYVINVKLSATTLQLLLLKGDSIIIGEPMCGKWHFRDLYR